SREITNSIKKTLQKNLKDKPKMISPSDWLKQKMPEQVPEELRQKMDDSLSLWSLKGKTLGELYLDAVYELPWYFDTPFYKRIIVEELANGDEKASSYVREKWLSGVSDVELANIIHDSAV